MLSIVFHILWLKPTLHKENLTYMGIGSNQRTPRCSAQEALNIGPISHSVKLWTAGGVRGKEH